ncbi:MAG: DNA topoisomerase IV subunit A, partial [Alphaproteobacteria bacterium]|nr:DNA topoisomerase IV subunit A [Alphaproteobacteria bacterium]
MGKPVEPPEGSGVEVISLKDALEERYLAYALSTIMHRALPDARDGLKPVHRRLLYAMRLLRLDPGQAFKKCARVVGDVIGKYHPHGDQSVYDALVRLAQDFAVRYPLVDGQGNFGNIDGDNPAAMRYTEARLTEVARLLLDGLDEDSVDFRETYDGSEEEPLVLPAAFPNLLANGSQGIAVGMATSIPPHNAAELCDAALYLVGHPQATSEQLMTFVPGPDFPTGGIIVETRGSMTETYRTGRGSFRVRARWEKEDTGRGGWVVVITEIPYMVPKSRLIEKIAELLTDKKLPLLADVRDESAEDIRIVLEPRSRTVDAEILMESLFKLTELESRISMNMNVLTAGLVPRVLGLADVLREWLGHRRVVLERHSRFRLGQIDKRLEILRGLLIVYLDLDKVIKIIREEDEPKVELMRYFELNDVQADAILNTRLRSLRKLEEIELKREFEALSLEKSEVEALLGSPDKQWKVVSAQIREVKKSFSQDTALGKRRSTFADAPDVGDIDLTEAMVEREPLTVVLSQKGWIRALKGHVADLTSVQFKGDDELALSFHTETTAKILVLTTNGKVYTLDASKLPGGRGFGDPVRLMADIDEGADIVTAWPHKPGSKLLFASSVGRGFIASADDTVANTRKGRQMLNLDDKETARFAVPVDGDYVAAIGENRKLLCFPMT